MVYSDTSAKNGLLQRCEFWTGLGDAGITGNTLLKAQFTQSLNNWYQKIVTMILASQDEWDFDDLNYSDYPIGTTALVAGQRDYDLPASLKLLRIKRADVTYDGTNWRRVEPLDINEVSFGVGNASLEDDNFAKDKPFYDLKSNTIWLYPRADATDVANGATLRIEFAREVDVFTTSDTTQEPGIDEPFHEMIALGASFDFASIKTLPNKNDIWTMLQDFEARLKQYYGKKTEDRNIVLKSAFLDYN